MTLTGSYFLLKLSHKIKITLKDNITNSQKSHEKTVDKISINLGEDDKKNSIHDGSYEALVNKIKHTDKKINSVLIEKRNKNVLIDKELYKKFKKNNFSRLDLHGCTLENAKTTVMNYCEINFKNKNSLHIIITGLGNKPNQKEFFSGKIRNAFTQWIKEDSIQRFVYSYHPCKIQHGGLGAFYVKLRSIK